MTKCIIPNCYHQQAQALGNGLCLRCHGKAKQAMESGAVSKEELIGMGLILSDSNTENDPFSVELNKKLEGG